MSVVNLFLVSLLSDNVQAGYYRSVNRVYLNLIIGVIDFILQ